MNNYYIDFTNFTSLVDNHVFKQLFIQLQHHDKCKFSGANYCRLQEILPIAWMIGCI